MGAGEKGNLLFHPGATLNNHNVKKKKREDGDAVTGCTKIKKYALACKGTPGQARCAGGSRVNPWGSRRTSCWKVRGKIGSVGQEVPPKSKVRHGERSHSK